MQKKNIISLFFLLFFIFLSVGSEDNLSPEEKAEADRIEKEYKSKFTLDTNKVGISSLSLFGFGGLTVKNKSSLNWSKMYIIINPPISEPDKNDGFQIAKSLFEYGVFKLTKEGFRAPSNPDKVYINTYPGETVKISYGDFIHTKTKEKFNANRYVLTSVFIYIAIEYKGRTFEESEIFTMDSKSN